MVVECRNGLDGGPLEPNNLSVNQRAVTHSELHLTSRVICVTLSQIQSRPKIGTGGPTHSSPKASLAITASSLSPSHSSIAMAFAWRNVFTYNRYSGIAARAVRRALKEDKRLEAERRNTSTVRVSKWKDGVQGEQKRLGTDVEPGH